MPDSRGGATFRFPLRTFFAPVPVKIAAATSLKVWPPICHARIMRITGPSQIFKFCKARTTSYLELWPAFRALFVAVRADLHAIRVCLAGERAEQSCPSAHLPYSEIWEMSAGAPGPAQPGTLYYKRIIAFFCLENTLRPQNPRSGG